MFQNYWNSQYSIFFQNYDEDVNAKLDDDDDADVNDACIILRNWIIVGLWKSLSQILVAKNYWAASIKCHW